MGLLWHFAVWRSALLAITPDRHEDGRHRSENAATTTPAGRRTSSPPAVLTTSSGPRIPTRAKAAQMLTMAMETQKNFLFAAENSWAVRVFLDLPKPTENLPNRHGAVRSSQRKLSLAISDSPSKVIVSRRGCQEWQLAGCGAAACRGIEAHAGVPCRATSRFPFDVLISFVPPAVSSPSKSVGPLLVSSCTVPTSPVTSMAPLRLFHPPRGPLRPRRRKLPGCSHRAAAGCPRSTRRWRCHPRSIL